jgi:hypothetical protein
MTVARNFCAAVTGGLLARRVFCESWALRLLCPGSRHQAYGALVAGHSRVVETPSQSRRDDDNAAAIDVCSALCKVWCQGWRCILVTVRHGPIDHSRQPLGSNEEERKERVAAMCNTLNHDQATQGNWTKVPSMKWEWTSFSV